MDWQYIQPILVAVVAGGVGALLNYLATASKTRREQAREDRRLRTEEDSTFADEVRVLRRERQEQDERVESLTGQLEDAQVQITALEATLARQRRALPVALVDRRLLALDGSDSDLAWVLDRSGGLFAITSSDNRGTFKWISEAWASRLGLSPDAVLGAAWRSLIHPDIVVAQQEAEASAWTRRVDGEVLCWRCPVGDADLRWYAGRYDEHGRGHTLAVALIEGIHPPGPLTNATRP